MTNTADSEFGREVGLIHKLIVTGRKVGANKAFYTRLADNEDFFRKVVAFTNAQSDFPIWKTVKLGTGLQSVDEFRVALRSNGFQIGNWANDILGKPAFRAATKETEVDLVVVSVADLGFKNGATHKDIYERANELGLELCPAEVGPQLRLQYKDQQRFEFLLVAMEPIPDSDGYLDVFDVERDVLGLWLGGDRVGPDRFWRGSRRWVFLRRK